MNRVIFIVAAIAACFVPATDSDAQQPQVAAVRWETNPYVASQKAHAESKLVLLHFGAQWCGPCQNQKRFVFSSPAVARAIHQVAVPVIVDIDANKALAQELNVTSIPFDVFLTPDGEVYSQRKSPIDTSNYIAMCNAVGRLPVQSSNQGNDTLAALKRASSPMDLPEGQRSNFTATGPSGVASVSPSADGLKLARRSSQRQYIEALSGNTGRRPKPVRPRNLDPQSELRHALKGLATDLSTPGGTPSKARFFEIPETRLDDPAAAYDPATNEFHPHRTAEHLERSAFLNKSRPPINSPRNAPAAQPVRVTNNHFFNPGKNAKMSAVPSLPGVEVSEMFSPATGQRVAPYTTGRSLARIHKESVPEIAQPSNEAKIIASSNARIESYKDKEAQFAQQASMIKEDASSQASGDLGTTVSAQPVDDFALHGKCPVALILQGQWVEGDPQWGIVHRDRTYLFSSEENYERFKTNPDRFSPVLSGFDPVVFHEQGKLLDGLEENGVFMGKNDKQHVVLFQSPETRAKFQSNPKLYMNTVRQAVYSASRKPDAM